MNIYAEKQILKLGNSKKSKAFTALALSLVMAGSLAGAVSAGNIEDTTYSYNSTGNGFATATRDKTDYTSAYIYHKGVNSAMVQVRSSGINYSANGGSYFVAAGSSSYLPNYVKENGRGNCYLYITPSPALSCYMYGQWSPDSI